MTDPLDKDRIRALSDELMSLLASNPDASDEVSKWVMGIKENIVMASALDHDGVKLLVTRFEDRLAKNLKKIVG